MDNIFAGEIATELVKELISVVRRVYLCRESADQLRRSVETVLPIITEISFSGVELPQTREKQISDLVELLRLGLDLTRKVAASSRFNVYRSFQLARKMEKVENEINRWIQRQMPAHILADVHYMRVESSVRFDRLEMKVEEAVAAGVREGRIRVSEMMDGLGFVGEREEEVMGAGVRVGRERVKDMLMNAGGGEVVGICGIGGSGKTTLARKICKDTQIRSMHSSCFLFFLLL